MITIDIIPILKDNYTYLLQSPCGVTAILDPGEAAPVINVLEQKNLTLNFILNTHHHWDHTDGNQALKKKYNAQIVAPEKEKHRIQDVDITMKDGDVFELGSEKAQIIETPGHTLGHVCFYFPDSTALFTGDTVFSMSCGRLFEGTPADMFESFQKIMALPDDTLIYCGHEYTKENAAFCLVQDPGNDDLKARIEDVKTLRAQNKPTLPISLGIEKKTNIFMKTESAEEFADFRRKKDDF